MFELVSALLLRIFSNPIANLLQKTLSEAHSARIINLYVYLILSLFCVFPAFLYNWSGYGFDFWLYVALAGILCTLGSICLIKALQYGEISILGPINSYKCIVGLIFGYILLGETPSISNILGILLIISGSWFIFDTIKDGFKFNLLLRKDIILRFCALIFTGCEAVVLKKIILISSPMQSFILWCFSGLIFTLIFLFGTKIKTSKFSKNEIIMVLTIAACLGIMQYTTNIVFKLMDVGLALALFQLSSLVTVFFGYKFFQESSIIKKIIGSIIMILGSCFILL